MEKDFDTEYSWLLEQAVAAYIAEYGAEMAFDGADLAHAVEQLLLRHLSEEKDHYVCSRLSGKSQKESMERVYKGLTLLSEGCPFTVTVPLESHCGWEEQLQPLSGCALVYADDSSRLIEHAAEIASLDGTKVLLSLDEIDDDAEFPEDCVAMKLEETFMAKDSNAFLKSNFPHIHWIANSAAWLLTILKPRMVVNFSESSIGSTVLEELSRAYDINLISQVR